MHRVGILNQVCALSAFAAELGHWHLGENIGGIVPPSSVLLAVEPQQVVLGEGESADGRFGF
jgi:hypothetical protein